MGVYIDMEMPKNCAKCKLLGEYGCPFIGSVGYAYTEGRRNERCPLTPVPPHGKLIDASKLIERLQKQLNEARAKVSAMGEYDIGYTPDMYIVDRDRDMIAILNAQAAFVPEEGE